MKKPQKALNLDALIDATFALDEAGGWDYGDRKVEETKAPEPKEPDARRWLRQRRKS